MQGDGWLIGDALRKMDFILFQKTKNVNEVVSEMRTHSIHRQLKRPSYKTNRRNADDYNPPIANKLHLRIERLKDIISMDFRNKNKLLSYSTHHSRRSYSAKTCRNSGKQRDCQNFILCRFPQSVKSIVHSINRQKNRNYFSYKKY